eukprot:gene1172-1483_t
MNNSSQPTQEINYVDSSCSENITTTTKQQDTSSSSSQQQIIISPQQQQQQQSGSTLFKTKINNNNIQNQNKNENQDFISCPIWASDPNPTRGDHLKFFQNGESTSFIIDLEEFKYIILGRSTSICNYVLNHPTVSRKHALIAHDTQGKLQILDLNSLHGTFIENKRIPCSIPYTLNDGERIRFGGDSSYFRVFKNNMNRKIAENLLEKRKSINLICDITDREKQLEEYNEGMLSFFSHINKTGVLMENDLDGIQSTIDQLTPSSSPKKNKRKSSNENNANTLKPPNLLKRVTINKTLQKFIYSQEDEIKQIQYIESSINNDPTSKILIVDPNDNNNSNSKNNNNNNNMYNQYNQQQPPIVILDEEDEEFEIYNQHKKKYLKFSHEDDSSSSPPIANNEYSYYISNGSQDSTSSEASPNVSSEDLNRFILSHRNFFNGILHPTNQPDFDTDTVNNSENKHLIKI